MNGWQSTALLQQSPQLVISLQQRIHAGFLVGGGEHFLTSFPFLQVPPGAARFREQLTLRGLA
jgi:hypothetical protein